MKIENLKSVVTALLILGAGAASVQAWHVRGKVVCDANGNGQVDVNDTPVRGVIVVVENAAGTFNATAATDGSGVFHIDVPHVADSYLAYMHPPSVPPGATLISPAGGMHSFALTDERQFFEEANFVLNCSPSTPPPSGEECGKVTGGGWIIGPSGEKANFSCAGGPNHWGHLNYIDHGTGLHVRSTGTTAYEADPSSSNGRIVRFDVMIGDTTGTAVVRVVDNGEPGRNDVFEITLSNGYRAGGDLGGNRPGGGNIQLHKCPPGKRK